MKIAFSNATVLLIPPFFIDILQPYQYAELRMMLTVLFSVWAADLKHHYCSLCHCFTQYWISCLFVTYSISVFVSEYLYSWLWNT